MLGNLLLIYNLRKCYTILGSSSSSSSSLCAVVLSVGEAPPLVVVVVVRVGVSVVTVTLCGGGKGLLISGCSSSGKSSTPATCRHILSACWSIEVTGSLCAKLFMCWERERERVVMLWCMRATHTHTHFNNITEVKLGILEHTLLEVNNGKSHKQCIVHGEVLGPDHLKIVEEKQGGVRSPLGQGQGG